MAYSSQLADTIRGALEQFGIHAQFEERGEFGAFIIRMKLKAKLQTAEMVLLVREDDFSTLTQIPLKADENSRLAVAEYLTRCNFNMRNGNFELNMENGDIRFKTYVHVGDSTVDAKTVRLAVVLPFLMLDRYGDGLLDVLFGYRSPREAFEAIGK